MLLRLTTLALVFTIFVQASALAQTEPEIAQHVVLNGDDDTGPVVLYDGKQISQRELANMDPAELGDIRILSGEEAAATLGKYADRGAIVVLSPAQAAARVPANEVLTKAVAVPAERADASEVKMTFSADYAGYILIDGKPATLAALQALQPTDIASIDKLDSTEAVKRFGEQAEAGAIIVTTK